MTVAPGRGSLRNEYKMVKLYQEKARKEELSYFIYMKMKIYFTNFNKTYLENESLVQLQNTGSLKHIFKSH